MPPAELDPFQAFLKGSELFFKQSGDEIGKAFDSVAQALSLPKTAEEQPTEAHPESLASAPAAAPAVEAPFLAPAPAVAVKPEPSTGVAPSPAAGVISEDAAVPEEQSTAAPETPVVAEVERSCSAVETATTATVEEPMVDFSKKKKKKKKKPTQDADEAGGDEPTHPNKEGGDTFERVRHAAPLAAARAEEEAEDAPPKKGKKKDGAAAAVALAQALAQAQLNEDALLEAAIAENQKRAEASQATAPDTKRPTGAKRGIKVR